MELLRIGRRRINKNRKKSAIFTFLVVLFLSFAFLNSIANNFYDHSKQIRGDLQFSNTHHPEIIDISKILELSNDVEGSRTEIIYREEVKYEKNDLEFLFNSKFYILILVTRFDHNSDTLFFGLCLLGVTSLVEFGLIIEKSSRKERKIDAQNKTFDVSYSIIDNESIILDFVCEYVNKNRPFEKEKVIPFVSSRFSKIRININDLGIKTALDSLINKRIIVEGSKLLKNNILSNSNRALLYNIIKCNPGIHFTRLVKTSGLNNFLVKWHLEKLIEFNLVKKEKVDNFEAYFDSNLKCKNYEIIHIISREKCSKILEFLQDNQEGYTKTHISKKLSIHPNTVQKYVEKLESFNLIIKIKSSGNTLYLLNEKDY
jgi:predicted transcriptional regulator